MEGSIGAEPARTPDIKIALGAEPLRLGLMLDAHIRMLTEADLDQLIYGDRQQQGGLLGVKDSAVALSATKEQLSALGLREKERRRRERDNDKRTRELQRLGRWRWINLAIAAGLGLVSIGLVIGLHWDQLKAWYG
jgi:hypothetical protein